jgi:Cys-tRNA(Pro)/Cys-tRNA(Cys) deacylase
MTKTNAMRILEKLSIPYETCSYEDQEDHELSLGAALFIANKLGIDPDAVFKTIVMSSETKELFVFCLPAGSEVNLKKARTITGVKDIKPIKPDALLSATGYVRGGCSPIGMKKNYPLFIDESLFLQDKVYISAGVRGVQLILTPENLVLATQAQIADITL